MPPNSADFLGFAHELADAAAAAILPHFRMGGAVENKSAQGFDPVTRADREGEAAMRALIAARYPTHGIIGEEMGETARGDYCWVLDPIDGTRAFISGLPIWGTLIALAEKGAPIIGLLDQPYIGERFFAARDGGAFWQRGEARQPLATRACSGLTEAVIATTTPELFENTPEQTAWDSIRARARLARYGGDCYNYALLATGQIDCVIEQFLQPYDIQALIPIIHEAGGVVSDWQGGDAAQGGQVLACGDKKLHAELLAALAEAR